MTKHHKFDVLPNLDRRSFLVGTAATGLVFGYVSAPAIKDALAATTANFEPTIWYAIGHDGKVNVTVGKADMGQHIASTMAQLVAEELESSWKDMTITLASNDPKYNDPILGAAVTGGSWSTGMNFDTMCRAGAAGRMTLIKAAADMLGVPEGECHARESRVHHAKSKKSVTYAQIVAGGKANKAWSADELKAIKLKTPDQYTKIGQSLPQLDIPAKTNGTAKYGIDVRVPGMLFAVVSRCPTFGGKAVRFDAAKAKAVPGVKHVVEIGPTGPEGAHAPGGVAVVAESTWAASQGRAALGIEWDHGPAKAESSATLRAQMEQLVSSAGKVCRNDGDADAALAKAAKKIQATYELPFVAHACMEPMNATVHVRPDGAEAWLPCQDSTWPMGVIAHVTGLKPEQIKVNTTLLGGGFGRKYHADYAAEAAQISKAVNAPVQVVWTREDDIQHDFYRPMSMHRLSGAVDEAGRPVVWHHRMSSTSIDAFWSPPDKAKPESSEVGGAVNLPYAIPHLRMEYAQAKTGVPVMWWRSVEHSITAFANECFLDELAHLAGQDPLKFRLDLLAEPRKVKFPEDSSSILETERLKGVLHLVAEKSGWGSPLPPGRARGIACHFSFDSYAAEVAEVSVEKGKIKVHRLVAAADCGRVILPDGVKAQVEGAVAYALSAALKGAITIKDGRCEQSNFHDFEVLRMPDMPQVEVYFVKSDAPPTGIGEPGLPPVAPAVMNAVFALTGKRLRRLPVKPADLA